MLLLKEGVPMMTLAAIALILVIIGALNWGFVGLFNYNLVSALFGENSKVSKAIYAIVGIAGIYSIYLLTRVVPCMAGPR
jgi:uncharacterized membrane protein YuzA (DUF378 family)